MTKKLFVGGLSWGTNDEQLSAAFAKFGAVASAKVILDVDTGRSRGFGFVAFADDEPAQRALQEMDGSELDGRVIRVNEAQEKPRAPRDRDRPAQQTSRPRPSGGSPRPSGGSPRPVGGRSDARRGRPTDRPGDDRFSRRRNTKERRTRGGDGFRGDDDHDDDEF